MTDALSTVRARRAEIAHAIELLRAEDDELATTEAVLQRLAQPSKRAIPTALRGKARPTTQREFVLDVLASSDAGWLRAADIAKHVRSRWGVSLSERSLRPLLSVMKRQKQIVRQGRLVALRERAFEPQKAGAQPEI